MATQVPSFQDICEQRYSAKSFDGNAISDEHAQMIADMIRLAPTSFNLQPWRVQVVTDKETKEKLQGASWGQPQVGNSSHLYVFCANQDVLALADRLEERMLAVGEPKEKVEGFLGMLRGFLGNMSKEQVVAWTQRQVYIALSHGLNAAQSLGIGSCPIEGFSPEQYKEILQIPDHLVPTVVMVVGNANDSTHAKLRFEHDEMFF